MPNTLNPPAPDRASPRDPAGAPPWTPSAGGTGPDPVLLGIAGIEDAGTSWIELRFDRAIEASGPVSLDSLRVVAPGGGFGGAATPFDPAAQDLEIDGDILRIRLPVAMEPGARLKVYWDEAAGLQGWSMGPGGPDAWLAFGEAGHAPGWAARLNEDDTPRNGPPEQADWALLMQGPVQRGEGAFVLTTADGQAVATLDVDDEEAVHIQGAQVRLFVPVELSAGATYLLTWDADTLLDAAGEPGPAQSLEISTERRIVRGSEAPDNMHGSPGDDELDGGDGDDTLTGGDGDDTVDGGDGIDVAVFPGSRKAYEVLLDTPSAALAALSVHRRAGEGGSGDGTDAGQDMLLNVEQLSFDDFTVDLRAIQRGNGPPDHAMQRLEELYVALFDRIPEARGLRYWFEALEGGETLESIAGRFHAAGVQFGVFAADQSEDEFIAQLYANVLGRDAASGKAPKADEIAYWREQLQSGEHSRGTLVLQMLDDVHWGFAGNPDLGWVERLLHNKGALAHWYAVENGLGRHSPEDDIAFGRELAALVTPDGIGAAIELVGIGDAGGLPA